MSEVSNSTGCKSLNCSCLSERFTAPRIVAITAVALVGIALVGVTLYGHFNPSCHFLATLGRPGFYGMLAGGGALALSSVALAVLLSKKPGQEEKVKAPLLDPHQSGDGWEDVDASTIGKRDKNTDFEKLSSEASGEADPYDSGCVIVKDHVDTGKAPPWAMKTVLEEEESEEGSAFDSGGFVENDLEENGVLDLNVGGAEKPAVVVDVAQKAKEEEIRFNPISWARRRSERFSSENGVTVHEGNSYGSVRLSSDFLSTSEEEEMEKAIRKAKEGFVKSATELLSNRNSSSVVAKLELDKEKKAKLETALTRVNRLRQPEEWGLTIHSSGMNTVFEVEGCPGLIFKVSKENPRDKKSAKEYVKLREIALKTCKNEGLHMIRIPRCNYFKTKEGKYVIVEEKIDKLHGEFYFQMGLYSWGLEEPRLEGYFKELFRQLTVFVCETGFADFKYDNIPLDERGNVVLIDLDDWDLTDEGDGLGGLTRGCTQDENDGLLTYLPNVDWVDEMVTVAKKHLHKDKHVLLDKEVAKIKEDRIEARAEFRKQYRADLEKRGIKNVMTRLRFASADKKGPRRIAAAFVEKLNEDLSETTNCDLLVGRRIVLEFGYGSDFLSGNRDLKFSSFRNTSGTAVMQNVVEALKLLKEEEVLFHYEYDGLSPEVLIYC